MEKDEKSEQFLAEYKELRDKYQRDFISIPQFIPTERGTWELMIVPQVADTSEQPVKSFIQPE